MRLLVTLLFFLSCIGPSLAQDHEYTQYTSKDGLPTNYVYGVIEDDDGYIWAYTENGMSKFDGYSFKNYSTRDGLPGNDVVYCLKDKAGKIWLYTYRNKPAYLFQDSFHIVYDQICIPIFYNHKESILYACRDSRLMTYQEDQIEFLSNRQIDSTLLNSEATAFQLDSVRVLPSDWSENNALDHEAHFVYISKDSVYYYSSNLILGGSNTKDGYLYYSMESSMIYWKNKKQRKSFYIDNVIDVRTSNFYKLRKEEKYLVRGIGGPVILFIDIEAETSKYIQIEDQVAFPQKDYAITIMDSTFLVRINQGFLEYDFDGNCTDKMILNDLSENYYLLRPYKDAKGNIWIGSREGGLFFIPRQNRKTSLLTPALARDKAFEQLIRTADGELLGITDNSGVYHILEDSMVNLLPPNRNLFFRAAINTPYGILLSSSGKGHLIKKKGKDFIIKAFEDEFEVLNETGFGNSSFIGFDNLDNLVALAYNKRAHMLYTSNTSGILNYLFLTPNSLKLLFFKNSVSTLYYHPIQEIVYGGNSNGVFRIEAGISIPFLQEKEELKNISVLYSTTDKLWIGTEGNGLFTYNFTNKKLVQISEVAMVRRIRADTDSTLLIASNEGILSFHKTKTNNSELLRYTLQDGLPTNEIQDIYADGKRYIYVATSEGIHKLDRTFIDKTIVDSNDLQITNIQVNKKRIKPDQLLELSYLENTLDIQYNLLSYASNTKIRYYTKLEPFQTDWNESDSRKVNYLSLPPNDYTFYLKAKDVYGNEISLKPIDIKIRKAFWQTSWFKLLLSGLALFILFGIIYKRDQVKLSKLEEEKRINRKMAELELSALKAQMNPHFVFNALGAIQYFIQTNEVEAADNYLARFARLMRKYLDSSKEKMIPLNEELELLTIYTDLEKLRFEDLFEVEIKVSKNIQPDNVYLPSMIIQPFIENAINHGLNERRDKQGLLQIHFTEQNGFLLCTISDNGIGRKNAQKNKWEGHQSRGMSIIEEKIHTLKFSGIADVSINISDLYPSQTTYPGTQVTLKINNLEDEQI